MSRVHYERVVADGTFGLGGLFPLLGRFLFGAIFLVGVGGVVVIVLLLGLLRVIFVSLVNISVYLGRGGWNDEQSIRLWGGANGVATLMCVQGGCKISTYRSR